jgi:hypothetical protein
MHTFRRFILNIDRGSCWTSSLVAHVVAISNDRSWWIAGGSWLGWTTVVKFKTGPFEPISHAVSGVA